MSTLSTTNLKNPSSGSNNVVLNTDGTTTIAAPSNIIKSGTSVASTSGVSIDFTGIPSWAKRVTVMFSGVSTSGTSGVRLQVGSGSVTTTGYNTTSSAVAAANVTGVFSSTSGLDSYAITAATSFFGKAAFLNLSGNSWIGELVLGSPPEIRVFTSTTQISLSGTLDRVRITTVNGTDTFDAGSINILFEG
jgi:hypothetical protein